MNVQHASGKVLHELRAENAHITRQHHQIRLILVNGFCQRDVKRRTVGIGLGIQRMGGNVCRLRTLQAISLRPVAEYRHNFGGNPALLAGINQRLEITPLAGDQHHDLFHQLMTTCCSSEEAVSLPIFHAFSPAAVNNAMADSTDSSGRAITMPTPQLKVRYIS
ncbi:hypothetical protein D3C78_1171110 [compost metagenome]